VRLSVTIALPSDNEINSIGAQDAGEYLLLLREAPEELEHFLQTHEQAWFREPRQQVGRCVDHMLNLFARVLELNSRGPKDVTVQDDEMAQFIKVHDLEGSQGVKHSIQKLASMQAVDATDMDQAMSLSNVFRDAEDAVKEKLIAALRRVEVFQGLSEEQLELLHDCMREGAAELDQYVFNQGEVGTGFYVITDGEAEVLREDPDDKIERVIAKLGRYDYFGERALVKNEPRYASVRAKTKVFFLTISQSQFEFAFGSSLMELLPDKY